MDNSVLAACLGCSEVRSGMWADALARAMGIYEINTPMRMAAFLAQVGHETGGLMILEENMNYSEAGLRTIFPKHFTEEEAREYARKPERIGARAYAGRMGNGDEASGDGYRYRGRGLLQMTGRDDYAACGKDLGESLVERPELVTGYKFATLSAGWEWHRGNLNAHADLGEFDKITHIINGGTIGQQDRNERYAKAKRFLGLDGSAT